MRIDIGTGGPFAPEAVVTGLANAAIEADSGVASALAKTALISASARALPVGVVNRLDRDVSGRQLIAVSGEQLTAKDEARLPFSDADSLDDLEELLDLLAGEQTLR